MKTTIQMGQWVQHKTPAKQQD